MDAITLDARREAWTVDDWLELRGRGRDLDWRRFEIDDGALVVSPPPAPGHDVAASRLVVALARQLPADLEVFGPGGLELTRFRVRIPDVVVVPASAIVARRILRGSDVILAVEVESPSSVGRDRIAKPAQYAEAGIRHYWRVEHEVPRVTAYELQGGVYVEVGAAHGVGELALTTPFPLSVCPSSLVAGGPR